jgi:hypothetical protein
MLLGLLLLLFLIFKPRGIIPEKNIVIKGVDYIGITSDKETRDSDQ